MTVLLTGYEPVHIYEENPSAQVARRLNGATVTGLDVASAVLPNEFGTVGDRVAGLIDEHDPRLVLSTGLGQAITAITVERVAVNMNDAGGVPDDTGETPRNGAISAAGPDAYLSTLPITEIVHALLDAGIPAQLSNTAGTHCCNNIFYSARRYIVEQKLDVPSGFIHLPFTPVMAARDGERDHGITDGDVPPSMSLDLQVNAVKLAIEIAIGHLED